MSGRLGDSCCRSQFLSPEVSRLDDHPHPRLRFSKGPFSLLADSGRAVAGTGERSVRVIRGVCVKCQQRLCGITRRLDTRPGRASWRRGKGAPPPGPAVLSRADDRQLLTRVRVHFCSYRARRSLETNAKSKRDKCASVAPSLSFRFAFTRCCYCCLCVCLFVCFKANADSTHTPLRACLPCMFVCLPAACTTLYNAIGLFPTSFPQSRLLDLLRFLFIAHIPGRLINQSIDPSTDY